MRSFLVDAFGCNLASLRAAITADLGETLESDKGSAPANGAKGKKGAKGTQDADADDADAGEDDKYDEDDEDDEEDEEDEPKPKKRPAAHPKKGDVLKKPAAVKLNEDASAVEVLKARKNVIFFPRALKQMSAKAKKKLKDRPKIGKKKLENAHYMSGHIYPNHKSAKGPLMRVFTRKGDRHEQRIPYDPKDRADAVRVWDLACACIETDPRPVEL